MKSVVLVFILAFVSLSSAKATANDNIFNVGKWYLGVSLGGGQMQSPLHEQSDIPLSIVPDIRYYGERITIENLDVSFAIFEKKGFALELIGEQNQDGVYFPGNFRKEYGALIGPFNGSTLNLSQHQEELLETPGPRSMSYMSGIELRYYNWINAFVSWTKDISDVHNGESIRIDLQKTFSIGKVFISVNLKTTFKDEKLVHYYYGFDQRDTLILQKYYAGSATTNQMLQANVAYPLTEELAIVAAYSRTWLGDSIKNSPVVTDGQIDSSFFGVKYVF